MQGLSRLAVEPDATPPVASALVTSLELAGVPQPIDDTDVVPAAPEPE